MRLRFFALAFLLTAAALGLAPTAIARGPPAACLDVHDLVHAEHGTRCGTNELCYTLDNIDDPPQCVPLGVEIVAPPVPCAASAHVVSVDGCDGSPEATLYVCLVGYAGGGGSILGNVMWRCLPVATLP